MGPLIDTYIKKGSVIDTSFIDQSIRREIIFTSPYCKKSDFSGVKIDCV